MKKLNKLALTLSVAALLPTFVHAGTDPVVASFERDMHRESVSSSIALAGEVEPLIGMFNAALYDTADPVLASFERDMYHGPVASATVPGETDSLSDIFNTALRAETGKSIKQVLIRGNRHGS